jgi:ribulose-phosphate 3-epimerase
MAKIIPAILVDNIEEAKARLALLPDDVDTVSIDIMDGTFVDPTTFFDAEAFGAIDSEILFELDLMVNDPMPIIEAWAKIPRTTRAIIHAEIDVDIREALNKIHDLKLEAGIAILPETELADIEHLMNDIDMILIRGNQPGYSGKEFDRAMLGKIVVLSEEYPHIGITVDIGVNMETIPDMLVAGATHLSVNSAIFGKDDPVEALRELQELAS